MTLQDLVRIKESLAVNTQAAQAAVGDVITSVAAIGSLPTDSGESMVASLEPIVDYYRNIKSQLGLVAPAAVKLIAEIDAEIKQRTATWDRRGYMTNGYYGASESTYQSELGERDLGISVATQMLVQGRLDQYVDWRYPGLEIGPGKGTWTKALVACDPLYVCDIYDEFLTETRLQFPANYQNRLRTYKIDRGTNSLAALPQGQFGFVFAWNVFNFFPQVELTHYLKQIFQVLRPGGVAMFSYNNCDRAEPAKFAEIGWMSWVPVSQLVPLVTGLGFEVIHTGRSESNIDWIEIRKPGQLTTAKAHQVMGEIKSHTS